VTTEAFKVYTEQILAPDQRSRLSLILENLIPWKILATRDRNAFNLLWNEAVSEKEEKSE
jgi:hypothetical protein